MIRSLLLALAWIGLAASFARADSYEWERTERLLRRSGLELAEAPEGKRIAWVRIVRDEVFAKDEIWPYWFNWFHRTTRDDVVRRELLFREGEPFREARSEESMRNLRGMGILALVRIVAVRVPDANAVGVLVHTRDLWSLRLETGFNITTLIDQLTLRLVETNFLGRNKSLAAQYTLRPKSYALHQQYFARRVWGSSVMLKESAGIVLNRDRHEPEGSFWELDLGQLYYKLSQRYAWRARFKYENYVARALAGKDYQLFPMRLIEPDDPQVRRVWRQEDLKASLTGFIRLGERFKQTWAIGWDVRAVDVALTAEAAIPPATMVPPELAAAFDATLPRLRTEIGPIFSYQLQLPVFQRFENLVTFGQTENVRVGPVAELSVRAPLSAFGSNSNSWVFATQVGCVFVPAGFLIEARLEGFTRYEEKALVDQHFDALLRGASPVLFGAFRLVARTMLEARRQDTAQTYVTLGASNGLRGYPSQTVVGYGASRMLANFELRTLPLEWQAVHVGAALFYDVGTVYHKLSDAKLYHAVGVGLRVLFPQLNREVFALDGGMSFDPGFRFVPTVFSKQVVPLTVAEDPEN